MNINRLTAGFVFYPTLFWNMLLGRWLKVRNWWDRVDDNLIVGAFPFARDVDAMAADGVKAVVNTCEEYGGPQEEYRRHGIEQFHMPTIDFTHPSLEDVIGAVEFIDRHADQGNTTYVHCKAGRARSATVAMCWLIKSRQITAAEAQKILNQARPHVNQQLPSRPVVQEFEKRFLKES
ncbi:MAG: dual specificity protein phosphatase family protein [Planctomycetota bacterium]